MQKINELKCSTIDNRLNNYKNISVNRQILEDPKVLSLAKKLEINEEDIDQIFTDLKNDLIAREVPPEILQDMINRKLLLKLKALIIKNDPEYHAKLEDQAKTNEEYNNKNIKMDDDNLTFNNKPVKLNPGTIHLFCEQIPEKGDLYLKHKKTVDGYFTEWYVKNEENIIKTRSTLSKNSLAVSNQRRDKNLIEIAKYKFDLNVENHLKKAGEFINENSSTIFPIKKSLINRSKKERQIIQLSEELDKNFKIVINRLTGQLHIYSKKSGIYQSYNETEFSAFLTKEYKQKFLADETKKIMGTFTKLIDESEKYIAFKNCLLNLDTLETEKFTSKEFVTFQIPFNWNPKQDQNTLKTELKIS